MHPRPPGLCFLRSFDTSIRDQEFPAAGHHFPNPPENWRLYITGTPGSRDWYANLVANPQFTFHIKQSAQADLTARAASIRDQDQRRDIISRIHQKIGGNRDLEAWVEGSPLVEVELLPD